MGQTTGVRKWQLAEARILKLGDQANGRPKPEMVVADARDATSPLHDYFDWNDETAAHAHRLDVARRLIGATRIVIHRGKTEVATPRYVRDPALARSEQGYVDMPNVRANADTRRDVLAQEMARAIASLGRSVGVALALDLDPAPIIKARRLIEGVASSL